MLRACHCLRVSIVFWHWKPWGLSFCHYIYECGVETCSELQECYILKLSVAHILGKDDMVISYLNFSVRVKIFLLAGIC